MLRFQADLSPWIKLVHKMNCMKRHCQVALACLTRAGPATSPVAGQECDGAMASPSDNDKPPLSGLELDYLGEDLPYLTRVLRACIRAENAVFYKDFDTEPGDIAIINLIGINPGISQNDLAAAVVLKKSAVTKVIKHLEQRGLVQRRKVSSDKRYNALSLTEKGEEKRHKLREGMQKQHDALLAPFSPEERAQMFEHLRRLCDHLSTRNAARIVEDDVGE
ncbi:MAG: MarR family winged helix-turn-helix transcriptional regulator [Oricola sp.]